MKIRQALDKYQAEITVIAIAILLLKFGIITITITFGSI